MPVKLGGAEGDAGQCHADRSPKPVPWLVVARPLVRLSEEQSQLFLELLSVLVVRLGQKNGKIVGKRHNLILFRRAQKIIRLLGTEGRQQSVSIEFFSCHASTLLACTISTTFTSTAGSKKKVVFLFEDSTILAMPKPAMTPEDVEALTKALQAMHAAEVDLQKAFLEQRPWEERDKAIKKARETRYAWISLGGRFFTNWPV